MPCNGGHSYGDCIDSTRGLKKTIDELTRMLCYLCGFVTENNLMGKVGSETISHWWSEHQKSDFDRVQSKMIEYCEKEIRKGPLNAESIADVFINKALKVHDVSAFHKAWFLAVAKIAIHEVEEMQEFNKERKAIRRRALGKLSPEEKKSLGL